MQNVRAQLFFIMSVVVALSGCAEPGKSPGTIGIGRSVGEPEMTWRANPQLPGVFSASGVGNPAQGGLYAVFGRMEKGARFPPHVHPDARLTTVIHGTMYLGNGERFDEQTVKAYPVGSVVLTPPNTPHFMWAKEGTVIMQESGTGPTGLTITQ
jgi:Cupin